MSDHLTVLTLNVQGLGRDIAEVRKQRYSWTSLVARNRQNCAQTISHVFKQICMEKNYDKCASTWMRIADRCLRKNFEYHESATKKATLVKELKDGRRVLSTQKEMSAYIQQFYQILYTQDATVEHDVQAQTTSFTNVPCIVTEHDNIHLCVPLSK